MNLSWNNSLSIVVFQDSPPPPPSNNISFVVLDLLGMNGVNETELSAQTTHDGTSYEREAQIQNETIQRKHGECQTIISSDRATDRQGFCESIWDGVYCWPRSKGPQLISVPCPDYVVGFNHHENATRYCTDKGEWYYNPDFNGTWTNYSLCLPRRPITATDSDDKLIAEWLPIIKTMSQIGYGFSLVTLLIAFFILVSIKKLRCPRNTLHMHLFGSFMLRAFMALLKDSLFIDGVGLPQSIVDGIFEHKNSNWECKLVTSLWQYFIVANYTWILMEGLYLHNLIFLAPFSDSSAITLYVVLGWGCPIPVVCSWVASRIILDDTLCWTTHDKYSDLFLIIRIPIIISIVLNFLFFMNITRVLLVKLQSAVSIESRKYRYRKWAKSTLVLCPLFGVHYFMFLGISHFKNPLIEVIWLFCDQLFASFQGFFVAILYCLLNGEVRSELCKKWNTWKSDDDSKNLWVPLHHIASKFQRKGNEDVTNGMSGTSFGGGVSNCTTRQPLTDASSKARMDREVTEEHHIEITQGD